MQLAIAARLPQLDGLRGVAILLVLAQHWIGLNWTIVAGRTGVTLFFILSGYLITGILLGLRNRAEQRGTAKVEALRLFYVRRALRIFPPFYLVLAVASLIGVADARDYLLWHATYLSNLLFVRLDAWLPSTSHLWSLAVEEQFYLAWPLLMLWLPRRHLWWTTALAVIGAPLSRVLLLASGTSPIAIWVLPPCVMDALGLGALLALVQAFAPEHGPRVRRIALYGGAAAFLAYYGMYSWFSLTEWNEGAWNAAMDSLVALMLWPLVAFAVDPGRSAGMRWLARPWLTYLGRISYMVYLLHLFMPEMTWLVALRAGLADHLPDRPLLVVLWATVTFSVAALSWRFFEQPILARRRSGG